MELYVVASPDSWYLADLRRAAEGRHNITAVSFRQLSSWVTASFVTCASGRVDLAPADCVLVRTMPPGSLEQVVFRMDLLGRLEQSGTVVINPPRSLETAVDKYLALAKLQGAGLAIPKTFVCQTVDDAMEGFKQLSGDVVVKPLFGSEGRGMMRITDENLALRAFKALSELQAVIYLQEFVLHQGYDVRVLVVGNRVLAMKRKNHRDWRTNVARGAETEAMDPTESMIRIARRAADAVGAPLAGVDLLPARDGTLQVIEVNAVPGWKALATALGIDVAGAVLNFLETRVAGPS
jgi:ribosomal protein S6--L-glutamate ligase